MTFLMTMPMVGLVRMSVMMFVRMLMVMVAENITMKRMVMNVLVVFSSYTVYGNCLCRLAASACAAHKVVVFVVGNRNLNRCRICDGEGFHPEFFSSQDF